MEGLWLVVFYFSFMKKLFFLLLVWVIPKARAQTLQVIDKTTRQELPSVLLYAPQLKTSVSTNAKGQAEVSPFIGADTIFIKLVGYVPLLYSYTQLAELHFRVELSEGDVSLEEVSVTTNRTEVNKLEVPNRIEKLNMNEVAFQNPQTTADLLGTSGYAFIQKSQLGGGSPMLRGMATNRVLLVVDGVRMNNAIFRAGNLQNVISLDANALESTEILFGPGSVLYGSDALGGVMSFKTLEPRLADTASTQPVHGHVLARTSSANAEKTVHADVSLSYKRWAFVSSITHSDYSDLRSGTQGGVNSFYRPSFVQTIDNKDYMLPNPDSSLQVGSKYNQSNVMQKIRFKPNTSLDLDYGFHYSVTSPYNRYDRLYVMQTSGPYKNKLRWAEWYYGPQKWNMHKFGLKHHSKTGMYSNLVLTAALQQFEESRYDREFMVRELRMQKETVKALSLNLDLEKQLSSGTSLYYGLELIHNKVGSQASLTHVISGETSGSVTRYPDGSIWQSTGAYLSLKQRLHKRIILNLGGRYSYYRIQARFDTTYFPFPFIETTMSHGTFNGSIGLVFAASSSWQLYANAASGFRAPNIDDMGKVFESTPGYLVVPNPDLKPERAYNGEVGLVKTVHRFLKIDFAGYFTQIQDAMERMDFTLNGQTTIRYQGNKSNIQAVQNVAMAQVYGFQTGFDFLYKGLGLKSVFSYQKGKEQSGDSLVYYPLRHAAPMFGSTHLTYQAKKIKLDFYAIYNGRMDFEDLALSERLNPSYARDYSSDPKGKPYSDSWYTLNFKLAFYPLKTLAITAGVENIADLLYRPYSSGINAPGRNYIGALRFNF